MIHKVHEVNTRTFYLNEGMMETQRGGEVQLERPKTLQVTPHGLFWSLAVDGKDINHMQAHVLPDLNIQVIRFGWKDHAPNKVDYYIDMLSFTECSFPKWHLRDLYLDLVVMEGRCAEVLDTDEYLAAIDASYLDAREAALALTTLHNLMNALAKHSYRLESYLAQQHIHLEWEQIQC